MEEGDGQSENTEAAITQASRQMGEEQPPERASWLWSEPLRSSPALSAFHLVDFFISEDVS